MAKKNIPNIPYRYCFNSEGIDVQGQQQIFPLASRTHIPSLDGYFGGDKLTLAWEGEIPTVATERGCEILFRLFNEPWARPDEYAGPSLSLGDVITFFPGTDAAVSFTCDRVGFIKTDISSSQIESHPVRWTRSEKQLEDYRRIKVADTSGKPWSE